MRNTRTSKERDREKGRKIERYIRKTEKEREKENAHKRKKRKEKW